MSQATGVTQSDVDRLKRLGLTGSEIFDIVAAAAARAFSTKPIDGLGFQRDSAYARMEPELRDVLVVGRPIDDA